MLTALIDGVMEAPPYLCLALVHGLLYGMLGVMDLTVAARFTAAAYGGWCANTVLRTYPATDPLALTAAILAGIIVSAATWALLRPLTRSNPIASLIGSLGLAQILQATFQAAFGASPKVFDTYPVENGIRFLGTSATRLQLMGLAYAITAILLTHAGLRWRGWGRRLKAIAADPQLAESVFGIHRARVEWMTVLIAAALLSPAAVIYTAAHGVSPSSATEMTLLAFVSAVVAGRERPLGAVAVVGLLVIFRSVAIRWAWPFSAGGILGAIAIVLLWARPTQPPRFVAVGILIVAVGLMSLAFFSSSRLPSFSRASVPSAFQELVPYCLVLAALLARPQGVFTTAVERKA